MVEDQSTMKSSVPGLAYPSGRDMPLKSAWNFLQGRVKDDGAEGFWRIRNNLYDLQDFARNHPGGAEWINLTKGTDITEVFEVHHITDKAEKLLPKFFVREATQPRSVPLTFEPNGFFCTFKRRAAEALKGVNFHKPSSTSNLIADFLCLATFLFAIVAGMTRSNVAAFLAGLCLTWTTIAAHNFFHMRDNFRMYYFDLSTMSSKDWRITHAMSHHMYPNTLWDHEIYALEPFFRWLPKSKSFLAKTISQLISPVVYTVLFLFQGVKRYYSVFFEYGVVEFRDVVPFLLPTFMLIFTPHPWIVFKMWLTIIFIGSFFFGLIGFNAAHHHPDIFHDGDIYRDNLDWGLLEMDAVRDREVIDDHDFLVLTNFGSHGLHHLLPTVDHSYLPLVMPAFLETCKEFGVATGKLTQWELMKGQFKQLRRTTPKKNAR